MIGSVIINHIVSLSLSPKLYFYKSQTVSEFDLFNFFLLQGRQLYFLHHEHAYSNSEAIFSHFFGDKSCKNGEIAHKQCPTDVLISENVLE